jgi:hypothetical protein
VPPPLPPMLLATLHLCYWGLQGIKWQRREVSHPPQSSSEVKNEWSYTFIPPLCLRGVERDINFIYDDRHNFEPEFKNTESSYTRCAWNACVILNYFIIVVIIIGLYWRDNQAEREPVSWLWLHSEFCWFLLPCSKISKFCAFRI